MAPIRRLSRNMKSQSSKLTNKPEPNADEPSKNDTQLADDFSDVSSDDSLTTDSEMEDLVQRTVASMTANVHRENTRTGQPKGSKSDTMPVVGETTDGSEADTADLTFVLDVNPNSKSDIRIEVDHVTEYAEKPSHASKLSNRRPRPTPSYAIEIESDGISSKSQVTQHAHSQDQEEETFISLEPDTFVSNTPKDHATHQKGLLNPRGTYPGKAKPRFELTTELDSGLDVSDTYLNFAGEKSTPSKMSAETVLAKSSQDKLLKNSILTPDFEKRHSVPPYREATRLLKRRRKKERESSTGQEWYNMAAVEMTDQLRNDIKAVRMRSALDPKRFYKHNDMTAMPKFVQVGTIVESPADFYHSRVPKKQRKQTIVEELLADAETRRYNKRKYLELQEKTKRWGQRSNRQRRGKKKTGK
ncbi:deoxynucleotidyltransferase terminal-interacting protein 2-like [Acanthaster planci]|uniref:Deoxynucleotidyltransferase terminal-interacting protein 2-like n=1 Tax=Acanthaster planci TaxID=133434 RepID=A0A8B7YQJ7_ACAPL|nr:deoxynucleotidyltransferase terminal-interacting protein 2-like [Acanthaster planci]